MALRTETPPVGWGLVRRFIGARHSPHPRQSDDALSREFEGLSRLT
jgi:hypothetical protein